MKHTVVPVNNVVRLSEAGHSLINRAHGMPGMGLIHGFTGAGKTTAVCWYINKVHGVYVRAMATWSPAAMLATMLREMGVEPRGSCAAMAQAVVQKLGETGRPLFIDEADYVVDDKRMVETLRDIHDLASVPVILIGMAGIDRKIKGRQQLTGRIAQWVEFAPCSLADARLLADNLCDVKVDPDLLERLHAESGGSARLLVVGLSHIEAEAKVRHLDTIGNGDWKRGQFFLGEAPRQAKAGR